jgi:hypothetical protein
VQTDKHLGLDNGQGGKDRREPTIKLHEEPAIAASQWDPTFDLASKDKDLMPQQRILSDGLALWPAPGFEDTHLS